MVLIKLSVHQPQVKDRRQKAIIQLNSAVVKLNSLNEVIFLFFQCLCVLTSCLESQTFGMIKFRFGRI
jgi:hypothetical protein